MIFPPQASAESSVTFELSFKFSVEFVLITTFAPLAIELPVLKSKSPLTVELPMFKLLPFSTVSFPLVELQKEMSELQNPDISRLWALEQVIT